MLYSDSLGSPCFKYFDWSLYILTFRYPICNVLLRVICQSFATYRLILLLVSPMELAHVQFLRLTPVSHHSPCTLPPPCAYLLLRLASARVLVANCQRRDTSQASTTNQTIHTTSIITPFEVLMTRQGRIAGLPVHLLNVVRRGTTYPACIWNDQNLGVESSPVWLSLLRVASKPAHYVLGLTISGLAILM